MPDYPILNNVRAEDLTFSDIDVPAELVVAGDPRWSIADVWHNDDNTAVTAAYRSTPGTYAFVTVADEFIIWLEGAVRITAPDGTSVDVGPGDFTQVKKNTRYEFEVRETSVNYSIAAGTEPLPY